VADVPLQDRYAPDLACFGCGPRNERGLHLKSFAREDGTVVARWHAEKHHEAYPGVLSGGIIGTLLDCHSLWTAAYALMRKMGQAAPPPSVTAEYTIKMRRPTPTDQDLELVARAVEIGDDRATVEAELRAGENLCATSRGLFVAVKPGHPAYHRW